MLQCFLVVNFLGNSRPFLATRFLGIFRFFQGKLLNFFLLRAQISMFSEEILLGMDICVRLYVRMCDVIDLIQYDSLDVFLDWFSAIFRIFFIRSVFQFVFTSPSLFISLSLSTPFPSTSLYFIHSICLSIYLSLCPSLCPITNLTNFLTQLKCKIASSWGYKKNSFHGHDFDIRYEIILLRVDTDIDIYALYSWTSLDSILCFKRLWTVVKIERKMKWKRIRNNRIENYTLIKEFGRSIGFPLNVGISYEFVA